MKEGKPKVALSFWDEMRKYDIAIPNRFCFGNLTTACAKTGDSLRAKQLFQQMSRGEFGFQADLIQCTQLVRAFASNLCNEEVLKVLEFIDTHNFRIDR